MNPPLAGIPFRAVTTRRLLYVAAFATGLALGAAIIALAELDRILQEVVHA